MYLFASPSSSQWQQFTNIYWFANGQLKLSETTFFFLGSDPISPTYQLHMYKFTLGNTSPDWALKMACPSGTWRTGNSESLLISSSIYTFFIYGETPSNQFLYMAKISVSDGSVSLRYKSSTQCIEVDGSGKSGNYIIASVKTNSPFYLLVFDISTNSFNIKSFTASSYILGIQLDTATGKYVKIII